MTLDDVILNAVIVSIPEEFIITIIILIFIKRYDFIDKYTLGESMRKIFFIVVIPNVIFTNITLFGLNISYPLRVSINIIVLSLFIIILAKEKRIFKVVTATTVTFILLVTLEMIIIVFLMYVINFDVKVTNNSPYMNFIFSIPSRTILVMIIYIVYSKKNSIAKTNLGDIWKNRPVFRVFIVSYTVINLFIAFHLHNIFGVKNIIGQLDYDTQIIILLTVLIIYTFLIVFPWIAIYAIYPSEKLRNRLN